MATAEAAAHAEGYSLRVEQLSLQFAGLHALDDVTFAIPSGGLAALIGPNGAGKSSLVNCCTGIYAPSGGRITVGEKDVTSMPTHRIARMGVTRTFQNLALFKGMTVLENLMVGRYTHGTVGVLRGMFLTPRTAREEERQHARVEEVMAMLEIERYSSRPAADLPYGLQKRVELGRALVQDPRLLFLDEPMTGMSSAEKDQMAQFIVDVHEKLGITVLLIEHDMSVVMKVARQVIVLDFGKKIADGTPEQVQRDPLVIEAYLGR